MDQPLLLPDRLKKRNDPIDPMIKKRFFVKRAFFLPLCISLHRSAMQHWRQYINRQPQEYMQSLYPSSVSADMIVVIPCLDEPDLHETIHSLLACDRPDAEVLVAVICNAGEDVAKESVMQNRITYQQTLLLAQSLDEKGMTLCPLLFEQLPRKHAGVGLARKIGMDLAIQHFLTHEKEHGVIVSLDADCTVSPHFLTAIQDAFSTSKQLNATLHGFAHRTRGDDPEMEHAVRQYESYLTYFSRMLQQSGFPWYWHTIGSTFAVSAKAYVKTGGMGRQQGGEDFYFLQKVFALGHIKELPDAKVYPLARFSDRIPFGTGPALQKILEEPDKVMKVYSRRSFRELTVLFSLIDHFFRMSNQQIIAALDVLNPTLVEFLYENNIMEMLADCKRNSATLTTFRKRFFHHFNAFRIIKYLNHVHPYPFAFEKITEVTG
jgi:hypothetical protein